MILTELNRGERTRLLLVSFGFVCVASAALIGRTAGDALFLSRYDFSYLSYMYVGTALVVCSVALVYGFFAGRMAPGKLVALSSAGLIAGVLLLRLCLWHPWGGFRIAAYLLGDLVVNLPMLLFWSFASLLFNPREAKRVFGFVGAAGTSACILAGLIIRPFVGAFGSANLLFVVAALLVGFLVSILKLSRTESAVSSPPVFQSDPKRLASRLHYYLTLIRPAQIRTLVLLVLATHVALTLIDFQFKAGARAQLPAGELAGFFGDFYAVASVVALVIQLFLVHRLLQKGGVALGLCLLPACLFAGSIGTYITGAFAWMVGTKFVVQILLFTIDTAALQMLYLGIPVQSRSQARAFADGMAKPVAIAVTGGALVGLSGLLPLYVLALGAAAASMLWFWLARVNHKSYVAALLESLGKKRFDPSEETAGLPDKTLEAHIRQSMGDASDDDAVYLLHIGRQLNEAGWAAEYRQLLQREAPGLKIEALNYLQKHGDQSDLPEIFSLLECDIPSVQSAAIRTVGALGDADDIEYVEKALADESPEVRAAAIAVLINTGDLDRLIEAGIALKTMFGSQRVEDRIAIGTALRDIQVDVLLRPLIGLLQDDDPRVQRAALEAASTHCDPALAPVIAPLLGDPAVDRAAAQALVPFGPKALKHLIPFLALRHMEGAFPGALLVPEVMAKIGDPQALPALRSCIETAELPMRKRVVQAYCSLMGSAPVHKSNTDDLRALALREMDLAHRRRDQKERYLDIPGGDLLTDALEDASNVHLHCAFLMLDVLVPGIDLMDVLESLQKIPSRRANALEILDNVLPSAFKAQVLAFFERDSDAASSRSQPTLEEILGFVQEDESPWLIAGALLVAVAHPWPLSVAHLASALDHGDPVVRETALFALHERGDPEDVRAQCRRFECDPDPSLREFARALAH